MSKIRKPYSGQRVVCANPKSAWFGYVGTITNFRTDTAGVKYDDDHAPPPTGRWTKKKLLVEVDKDGVPVKPVSPALSAEMARVNEINSLLAKARESAVLAIDVYNRSGTSFRAAGFLVMMVIAWTSAMLARFRKNGVDPHYVDAATGKVVRVDGAPKAWSPEDCVTKCFPKANNAVRANLIFAIRLRNKVEHTHCPPLDDSLFGECQALLNNFVEFMKEEFGEHHAVGGTLGFALQTSEERTAEQLEAIKRYFGPDVEALLNFVGDYREALDDEVYEDPRYRYRVMLIPAPANRERHADAAVRFLQVDAGDEGAEEMITKLNVLVRDKQVAVHGKGLMLPGQVAELVEKSIGFRFSASTHHPKAVAYFKAKGEDPIDRPEKTDSRYCVYAEAHGNHLYALAWVEKLSRELSTADRFEEVVGYPPKAL